MPTSPVFSTATAPFCDKLYQVRTVRADDADEHAHNLTAWEQSYDQISHGAFQGALSELQLPGMQVFREHTSQAVHQNCCVWPDAMWFGLADHAGPTRINGRLADASTIMLRPGHREFELVTPADYQIYGIVIQRDALLRSAKQLGYEVNWADLTKAEVVHVSDLARRACLETLSGLLGAEGHTLAGERAAQAVISALLPLIDSSEIDGTLSNSFMRRQRIVALARELLQAQHDQAVSIPTLCEHLHVSRRTLQYCFEEVLGISPLQYVRLMRLNGARRQLREAVASGRTVQDVASDWGFWHLSQFASDYRKLFGACPSAVLRQQVH